MPNQRLRTALATAGLTQPALAERIQVDPKSVERWITQDRLPHATTRARVAQVLGREETYFWPALLSTAQSRSATQSELVQFWPSRSAVPGDVWQSLIREAVTQLDILMYAGHFLIETFGLVDTIHVKSAAGMNFRILVGDPRCEAVRVRGREEGLPSIVERCSSSLDYLRSTATLPGVQLRTHATTLYASIYRFDDTMLINSHTYGAYAAQSPVTHLQKVPGGQLFSYYEGAFDRVWATGEPVP